VDDVLAGRLADNPRCTWDSNAWPLNDQVICLRFSGFQLFYTATH